MAQWGKALTVKIRGLGLKFLATQKSQAKLLCLQSQHWG